MADVIKSSLGDELGRERWYHSCPCMDPFVPDPNRTRDEWCRNRPVLSSLRSGYAGMTLALRMVAGHEIPTIRPRPPSHQLTWAPTDGDQSPETDHADRVHPEPVVLACRFGGRSRHDAKRPNGRDRAFMPSRARSRAGRAERHEHLSALSRGREEGIAR